MLMEIDIAAAETGGIDFLRDKYCQAVVPLAPVQATQELRTFDLPASIWWTMFAAYAVFFITITIATGRDLATIFMIAISAGYAIMYFGTASVMNAVGAQGRPQRVAGAIDTATGRLSYGAAFAQILTVPLVIAFFGCAVAVIRLIVAP